MSSRSVRESLLVRHFNDEDASLWDAFAAQSPTATFLHTRRFLNYHQNRFRDVSVVIENGRSELVGTFPAAVDPTDTTNVVSHPGATYGGIVHRGSLYGEVMVKVLALIMRHYRRTGFRRLTYKVVPYIYQSTSGQDDLYALFRLGGRRYRCDLSATVDLANRHVPAERRKRGVKKALKAGVTIETGKQVVERLWRVLEDNLAQRYNEKPVHTAEEILLLHSLFPKEIEFVTACQGSEVLAGTVLFHSLMVTHAQYIASTAAGRAISALDAVFDYCIGVAKQQERRYFDFGTSNERNGQYLNTGVYQFKREFGAGGVVYESYELDLEE